MKKTHQRKIHLFLALVFIIQSLVCPVYAIAEGIQDQNMPIEGVPQVDTPNFDVEQSLLESESEGDFSSDERESVAEIITGEEEDESPSSDTENHVEETPAEEMPENPEEQMEEQEESEGRFPSVGIKSRTTTLLRKSTTGTGENLHIAKIILQIR